MRPAQAGLERAAPGDVGVPRGATVAHSCKAAAFVDPVLEIRRLAGIDRSHLVFRILRAVDVHAVATRRSNHRGDDDLELEPASGIGHNRPAEGRDPEHEQVERAGEQFDDHEAEAGQQPDEIRFHARA